MHKHSIVWLLGMVSWLITGLVSLHFGLVVLGYNLASVENFAVNHPTLVKPAMIVIGIAGAYSLLLMVMMLLGLKGSGCGCSGCGTSGCTCK